QGGNRRLRACGPPAPALSAHRGDKAALFHVTALDGHFIATLQAGIRPFAQFFIKKEADMCGRDLVRRDVVAQLGIVLRILRVPGQIFPRKLAANQLRIFSKKKDATFKFAFVRALQDSAGKQRWFHNKILTSLAVICRKPQARYLCLRSGVPYLRKANDKLQSFSTNLHTSKLTILSFRE